MSVISDRTWFILCGVVLWEPVRCLVTAVLFALIDSSVISVSVYTAELYAILLAHNELSKQQHKYYLLFSDSLSKPQQTFTLETQIQTFLNAQLQ